MERWQTQKSVGEVLCEILTPTISMLRMSKVIQFWLMDPYAEEGTAGYPDATNKGELFFNIGNISEDVLRDDQFSYENGLGVTEQDATDKRRYIIRFWTCDSQYGPYIY